VKIQKKLPICLIIFISIWAKTICLNEAKEKIEVIKNKEPLYGQLKLDIAEEILIQESETNEAYIFKAVIDMAIDSSGNIYLLDKDRVLKYDQHGKYLKTIGRIGQGPGEYVSPTGLFVNEERDLYINDQGRRAILKFSENGNFKGMTLLKSAVERGNFFVDDKGYIYGLSREFLESGIYKNLTKIDREGNMIKKIAQFLETDLEIKSSTGVGGVVSGMKHRYSPDACFCPLLENLICFGENLKYELTIFDLEGNIQAQFLKEEKARSTSKDIRELERKIGKEAIKTMKFPATKPFFREIHSDEKGRIYVFRVKSILDSDKTQDVDIFDKHGQYLYQTQFPYSPYLCLNGVFFAIDNDQEGKVLIKKLKIRNYDAIRY